MRKNIIFGVMALVLLAGTGFGAWKLVKHRSLKPFSAVWVTPKGQVKLSAAEAAGAQKFIPALPGKGVTDPQAWNSAMKTLNEVQAINRQNQQNAK